MATKILGILNITSDSFSDGGQFLEQALAIEKGEQLVADGADILDIGAQSSNPDSEQISPELEWLRLETPIQIFKKKGYAISIDTYKPYVIRHCIQNKVDYLNNINSFRENESVEILQEYRKNLPELILMFSHNQADRAVKESILKIDTLVDTVTFFFEKKIEHLIQAGVPFEKLIFDPGMGFFLGSDPFLSIKILQNISTLKSKLGRILVSVSRKSFIGNLLGGISPKDRDAGTLACEIFASLQGVDYIRTHNSRQLKHAIVLNQYIYKKI